MYSLLTSAMCALYSILFWFKDEITSAIFKRIFLDLCYKHCEAKYVFIGREFMHNMFLGSQPNRKTLLFTRD